jgi:hypothetical protein
VPGKRAVNPITLFLQKVDVKGFDPAQCWPFLGAGKGNGYGNVNVDGQNKTAHSYAYELFVGPIPEGEEVCHSCDFRPCCNPDHLFPGTRKANVEDCIAKGRGAGGSRKHLSEATLQEIARRLVIGIPARRIATDLDVNYATITSIRRGDSYGWIAKQLPVHRPPGG